MQPRLINENKDIPSVIQAWSGDILLTPNQPKKSLLLDTIDLLKKLIEKKQSPIDAFKKILNEYKKDKLILRKNENKLLRHANTEMLGISFCEQLLTKNSIEKVINLLNNNANQFKNNNSLCDLMIAYFFCFPCCYDLLSKELQALLPLERACKVAFPPIQVDQRLLDNIVHEFKNPKLSLYGPRVDEIKEIIALIVKMKPDMQIKCYYALIDPEKIYIDYAVAIFSLFEDIIKTQLIKRLKKRLTQLPRYEEKSSDYLKSKKHAKILLFIAKALAHIPTEIDQTEFLYQEINIKFSFFKKILHKGDDRYNFIEHRLSDLLINFLENITDTTKKSINIPMLLSDIIETLNHSYPRVRDQLEKITFALLDRIGYDAFKAFDLLVEYGKSFNMLFCKQWAIDKMDAVSLEQKTILIEKYLSLFDKDDKTMFNASKYFNYLLTKLDNQHNKLLYAWVLTCRNQGKGKELSIKYTILNILTHIFKSGDSLSHQDAEEMLQYVDHLLPDDNAVLKMLMYVHHHPAYYDSYRKYKVAVTSSIASKLSAEVALKLWSKEDQRYRCRLEPIYLASIFKSLTPAQQQHEIKKWIETPNTFFAKIIVHVVDIKNETPELLQLIIKTFDCLIKNKKMDARDAMRLLSIWLKPELPRQQQADILEMLLRYRKNGLENIKDNNNYLVPLRYLNLSSEVLRNIDVNNAEEAAEQIVKIMLMGMHPSDRENVDPTKEEHLAILNACLKKLNSKKVVAIAQQVSTCLLHDVLQDKFLDHRQDLYIKILTEMLPYLPKTISVEEKNCIPDGAIYCCDNLVDLVLTKYSHSPDSDNSRINTRIRKLLLNALPYVSFECAKTIFTTLNMNNNQIVGNLRKLYLDEYGVNYIYEFSMFIPIFKAMKKAGQSIDEYFNVLFNLAMDEKYPDVDAINEGLIQILPCVSIDWIKNNFVKILENSTLNRNNIEKTKNVHLVLAHMITKFSYSEGRIILDNFTKRVNQVKGKTLRNLASDKYDSDNLSSNPSYILSCLMLNMNKLLHLQTIRAQSSFPEVLTDMILGYAGTLPF